MSDQDAGGTANAQSPGEPSPAVVLGVDYGTVRVGLALGYQESGLVVPLPVMDHPGDEDAFVERICDLARGRDVSCVVIGNPLHKSGDESPMSRTVARLSERLKAVLAVPVELQDERLTSVEAEGKLRDAGLRWWQYSKGKIDALAAMAIAQEYLQRLDPASSLDPEEPAEDPSPQAREKHDRRRRRKDARRRKHEGGDDE